MRRYIKLQNYFDNLIRAFWLIIDLKILNCKNQNNRVKFDKNRFSKVEYEFKIFVEYRNSKNVLIVID